MCRILALAGSEPFRVRSWLESFALRCRESVEYQGDGWGLAWWTGDGWDRRRTLDPIWSDSFDELPRSSAYLVHARSAFGGSPLDDPQLNMPFLGDGCAFAFNGELRGVRLSVPGANGALRLFNLFERFRDGSGDSAQALTRLDAVVSRRTEYVRALNVVVADEAGIHVTSRFNQEPAYFTMYASRAATGPWGGPISVVCSEPIQVADSRISWRPVPTGTTVSVGAPSDQEPACSS